MAENGRIEFKIPVKQWLNEAIENYPITIIPLDTNIIVDSTNLPGTFHSDPADQLIVATSRVMDFELITEDSKILAYPRAKLYKSGT